MKPFEFSPAECVPFRDRKAIERVLRIKKEGFDPATRNPDFRIQIVPDAEIEFRWRRTCSTASRQPPMRDGPWS